MHILALFDGAVADAESFIVIRRSFLLRFSEKSALGPLDPLGRRSLPMLALTVSLWHAN